MSTKKKKEEPVEKEKTQLEKLKEQRQLQLKFLEEYKARFFATQGAIEVLDNLIKQEEEREGK